MERRPFNRGDLLHGASVRISDPMGNNISALKCPVKFARLGDRFISTQVTVGMGCSPRVSVCLCEALYKLALPIPDPGHCLDQIPIWVIE